MAYIAVGVMNGSILLMKTKMHKPQWIAQIDLRDILVGIAAVALVVGLALISFPAALIIPAVGILVLGYFRKWY